MSRMSQAHVSYFGKVPSRGDFVKADHNHRLLSAIDEWLTNTMELFATDPRWKITYDDASPQYFALLGSRRNLAVSGYLVNSHDQSGRRYPFITASAIGLEKPLDFAARSPLALSRLWARSQAFTRRVLDSKDCAPVLDRVSDTDVAVEVDASTYNAHFKDFLEIQTLGSLENTLSQSGHQVSLKHIFPALGQLLQPVMASGVRHLDKGIALPLPDDPMYRFPVAAMWMDLIAPFLARADFEIAMFITAVDHQSTLVLGFRPTPEVALHSALDSEANERHNIALFNPEWADSEQSSDYDMNKLTTYLAQPGGSLRLARDTFREVFLGE